MNKLIDLMNKKKMTLIVSLPENSVDLARAAVNGGADALKVHCNVKHEASGVSFGPLEEEKPKLNAILEESKIPVGIVPGAEKPPTEEEMDEIIQMGFDYFDMYVHNMPQFMTDLKGITKIGAVDNKQSLEKIVSMKNAKFDAVEAAIIPHLGYGQNLTIGDLQYYISIAIACGLPVIVPTQRKITVEEVPILADAGVKAIMIGAIVTGKTPQMLEQVTRDFKSAIDSLEE